MRDQTTDRRTPLGRRRFLAASASSLAASALPAFAQAPASSYPGFIVRQQHPENFEFPLASLDSFLVPTERFFVRNHFPIPRLAAANWSLEVGGSVRNPFRVGHEELLRLPTRTFAATIECAGNNRVALVPRERGVLWGSGAVGNAEWTGVPLSALLDRAAPNDTATEVILEGADEGAINDEPRTPGTIRFARSVPLNKARRDVLLAHRMNGEPLTAAHGFPLRAVVPGWYGMASVKWLTRITVVDRPFQGYFQTFDYSYWDRTDGTPALRPIGEMDVKSAVVRPVAEEVIPAGAVYRIRGVAWTGEAEVTRVDVSVDGGATWNAARLVGDPTPHAWRLWEFSWAMPNAGRRTIMARATDSRGRVQPMTRPADRRNYQISHVLPIDVVVR